MYIINTADLLIERRSCVLQLQLIEQFSSNGLGKMIKELVQGSTNLMIHGNVYVSLLTRGMSMGINSSQMMIKVSQKILIFQPGPGCIETSVLTSGCTIMLLMLKFAGNKLIIVRPDGSFSLLLDVHRNYSLVIEQMTSMYRVRTLLRITDR